jgi:hypothetical protein
MSRDGIKEVVVSSLGDLLDRATPREPDQASGRFRENAVYRGMGNADWRLLTSLDRLGGVNPPHCKAHLEEHILRNFLRFARPYLPAHPENIWELLVIAEHHGLPTRLLDWTHSPLVALHFATLGERPGIDRVVWKLNWQFLHEHFSLPPVAFLVADLDTFLQERKYKSAWDFLNADPAQQELFACLLDPPSVTDRLSVQCGTFTLCSVKNRAFEDILVGSGLAHALTRFIIPGDRVDYIRDQLDLCTFDERRLFPGLDGIAAELRRYYSSSAYKEGSSL